MANQQNGYSIATCNLGTILRTDPDYDWTNVQEFLSRNSVSRLAHNLAHRWCWDVSHLDDFKEEDGPYVAIRFHNQGGGF